MNKHPPVHETSPPGFFGMGFRSAQRLVAGGLLGALPIFTERAWAYGVAVMPAVTAGEPALLYASGDVGPVSAGMGAGEHLALFSRSLDMALVLAGGSLALWLVTVLLFLGALGHHWHRVRKGTPAAQGTEAPLPEEEYLPDFSPVLPGSALAEALQAVEAAPGLSPALREAMAREARLAVLERLLEEMSGLPGGSPCREVAIRTLTLAESSSATLAEINLLMSGLESESRLNRHVPASAAASFCHRPTG